MELLLPLPQFINPDLALLLLRVLLAFAIIKFVLDVHRNKDKIRAKVKKDFKKKGDLLFNLFYLEVNFLNALVVLSLLFGLLLQIGVLVWIVYSTSIILIQKIKKDLPVILTRETYIYSVGIAFALLMTGSGFFGLDLPI